MLKKEDFQCIGTLGRSHGLSGELTAKLSVDLGELTEDAEDPLFLMLEERGLLIPFRVEGLRSKAGDIDLIKFAGLDDKEHAEHWVGTPIWLDRAYLDESAISSDLLEYRDLVGYEVLNAEDGSSVGRLISIDESTINTLALVECPTGQELLLPLAESLIQELDSDQKLLRLTIPLGLLDDSAPYDID